MKLTKLSLVVLAAFSTTAMAQTTVGTTTSNTVVQGASSTTVKSQYTRIEGGSAVTIAAPNVNVNGALNAGKITSTEIFLASPHGTLNVASELVNTKDAVIRNNAASIDRDNGIKDSLNAEVTRATAAETSLDNRKADKTTVEANRVTAAAATAAVQNNLNTEVQARIDGDTATLNSANTYTDGKTAAAITTANTYTDNRVTAVDNRVTTEVARVDGRIDATNTEVTRVDNRVTAVDNRVTAVDNRVTKVETKTQNITATAGNTYIKGDTFIDGNISAGSGIVDRGARRGEGIYEGKAIANGNDLMSIRQEAMRYAGQVGANTLSQANNYTDQRIGEVRKETNQVGAMAMAASIVGNVSPAPGKNFALTAGMGAYGGQAALAVGFTHRIAQNVQWTASVSTVSGGRTGVGAGVSWSF